MPSFSQWVMRTPSRLQIFFSIILFLITGMFFILKILGDNFRQQIFNQASLQENLKNELSEINKIWKSGILPPDYQNLIKNCSFPPPMDVKELNHVQNQCNPQIIECILNSWERDEKRRSSWFPLKNQSTHSYLQFRPRIKGQNQLSGYFFFVQLPDDPSLISEVFLENECHDLYLPQRFYPYGRNSKSRPIQTWDNFDRFIYSDRFLVTVGDYSLFKFYQNSNNKIIWDFYTPKVDLNLQEQKNYCSWRGKRLLSAQILHAHQFYPRFPDDDKNILTTLAKYPWIIRPGGDKSEPQCHQLQGMECVNGKSGKYQLSLPTWSEFFQHSGGPFESLDNWIDPEKNIKLSSYYASLKSPIHYIGELGHWNGQSFDSHELNLTSNQLSELEGLPPQVDIGFRCYFEVAN